jgi:hypothetical protein
VSVAEIVLLGWMGSTDSNSHHYYYYDKIDVRQARSEGRADGITERPAARPQR